MNNTIALTTMKPSKYGVTERKKQELDELSQKVLNAKSLVEQLTAIVDSLTSKSDKLKTDLATAETNKAKALSNKNLVDEVINNLLTLKLIIIIQICKMALEYKLIRMYFNASTVAAWIHPGICCCCCVHHGRNSSFFVVAPSVLLVNNPSCAKTIHPTDLPS